MHHVIKWRRKTFIAPGVAHLLKNVSHVHSFGYTHVIIMRCQRLLRGDISAAAWHSAELLYLAGSRNGSSSFAHGALQIGTTHLCKRYTNGHVNPSYQPFLQTNFQLRTCTLRCSSAAQPRITYQTKRHPAAVSLNNCLCRTRVSYPCPLL